MADIFAVEKMYLRTTADFDLLSFSPETLLNVCMRSKMLCRYCKKSPMINIQRSSMSMKGSDVCILS